MECAGSASLRSAYRKEFIDVRACCARRHPKKVEPAHYLRTGPRNQAFALRDCNAACDHSPLYGRQP
jgi:hypothetical protein